MASNKRELVLALVSDSSQFNRGLDQAEGKIKSFGKSAENTAKNGGLGKLDTRIGAVKASLGGLAAVAGGAFAASKIVGFAKDSIQAFSDLNESINAVDVTFGQAARGIKSLGEDAAETLGLSNAEFNSLAVGFSAFVDQIAAGGGSVVGTMDELTTRIADFASVMNLDVNEAAEKFRSGLAGETEPLRKFGLDVSAAAVKTKALELGLTGVNDPLTEQEKILARYELIMDQTNKTAGDFANTSDDLANSLRITNAKFTDFKAELGEQFVPLAEKAVDAGSNLLSVFDEDVNLGWSQQLSAAFQTLLGESEESVDAYIREKAAINERNDALSRSTPITDGVARSISDASTAAREGGEFQQEYADAVEDTADETDGLEQATRKVISRLEEFNSVVRSQVDPVFNLRESHLRLVEAQQSLVDAQNDFGQGSPEYLAALSAMTEAGYDLQEAQIRVAEESHLTREAFETQLRGMRIFTEDQIAAMLAEFEKINGFKFNDKDFHITVHGKAVISAELADKTAQAAAQAVSSTVSSVSSIKGAKAAGGPVDAGGTYLVGEKGPELFTPNQNGRIIPNSQISGGGITVNQTFERVAGDHVAEDIQRGLLVSGLSRYAEVG